MKHSFEGKVALITGSSSGIGAEVARRLASFGAKVVITGYESDEVRLVADEIESIRGERPLTVPGDLTAPGFASSLVEATIKRYGKIDILINNAGRVVGTDSIQHPDFMANYDLLMDINLKMVFMLTHLCVPHLKNTRGCIVNISSIAAFSPLQPLYSASKAAIVMLTKSAAVELGSAGIRVNAVSPGPIRTNIGRSGGMPDVLLGETSVLSEHSIMKRNGEPKEVAEMIIFLASESASFITGVCNIVDGGYCCV